MWKTVPKPPVVPGEGLLIFHTVGGKIFENVKGFRHLPQPGERLLVEGEKLVYFYMARPLVGVLFLHGSTFGEYAVSLK